MKLMTTPMALMMKNSAASCAGSRPPRFLNDHSRLRMYDAITATTPAMILAVIGLDSRIDSLSV